MATFDQLRLGIVGVGAMGGAIARGLVASGAVDASQLCAADQDAAKLAELERDGKLLAVSAGQPFLAGQATLPHFEHSRNATAGIPAEAEAYINADNVASIRECGSFRHGITVHKIECKVLHVKLTTKAGNKIDPRFNATWVKKEAAAKKFANSFSLKAIKLAFR